jgi:carboxynorspermidine decarboxylase
MLKERCEEWATLCGELNVSQLFPIKCQNIVGLLQTVQEYVAGFAVSSQFEATLAREISPVDALVQMTSPSLTPADLATVLPLCDGFSFNSLSQWRQCRELITGSGRTCGLRVNPQLSFVADRRYDPCAPESRLGVPLGELQYSMPLDLAGIEGVHFHTNAESEDWSPLLATVRHLDKNISHILKRCRWINLGGGYLLSGGCEREVLAECVKLLRNEYDLKVFIEPGAGVVRDACFIVAGVVDLIESDGKAIAILDTTVNHIPEVFEYQFSPTVLNETQTGAFTYSLTGGTCLAGDVFGDYSFDEPLEIGSRVIFSSVGAYSFVKSHMFNGINLPTVFSIDAIGRFTVRQQFTYEDFRGRLGSGRDYESIRGVAGDSLVANKRRGIA